MATPLAAARPVVREHRFFRGIAVAILVVVVVGFAPTFFLRPLFPRTPAPTEAIFYVHGAAFSAWIVLLLAQTALVGSGRADIHRRVGPWGAVLAAAMVVLGILGALVAARRPTGFVDVPVPPLQFLAIPLADMALFGTFVALAVLRRRDAATHKRLMVLATVSVTPAAIARWPVVGVLGPPAVFGLTDLFVVALAVFDYRLRGRVHPVTLWGGLALVASQPLRLFAMGTDAWLAFARWATGLLG